MYRPNRPFLMLALLLSIALRTVMGAPCCMDGATAAQAGEASHHAALEATGDAQHSDHDDGPTAKPCCSACGPTLPPETALFVARDTPREQPEPAPIRSLATRPPFAAYDATGPPALI